MTASLLNEKVRSNGAKARETPPASFTNTYTDPYPVLCHRASLERQRRAGFARTKSRCTTCRVR
eukprot:9470639-Pyramimonas_sp.AAC.2